MTPDVFRHKVVGIAKLKVATTTDDPCHLSVFTKLPKTAIRVRLNERNAKYGGDTVGIATIRRDAERPEILHATLSVDLTDPTTPAAFSVFEAWRSGAKLWAELWWEDDGRGVRPWRVEVHDERRSDACIACW